MIHQLAIFQGKHIRRTIHNKEWWFSVVDVVEAPTDSTNPRDYWYRMKIRVKTDEGAELSTFCRQLKLESGDGKKYLTDCTNTESLFRIIQSIPSPKAEPFKRWLAKVGYERVQEIEDPELTNYTLSFSVSLSFSRLSFPPPICHSRESGNPVEDKLQWAIVPFMGESSVLYA